MPCDFDGDGNVDLAAINYFSNTVAVLLGTGTGSFAAAVTFSSGGSYCIGLAAADFNGDGQPDLAIGRSSPSSVGVLLNQSNSSWKTLTSAHGLLFDVAMGEFGAGELIQGSNNVFDGDGRLLLDGIPFHPDTSDYGKADSGQTLVSQPGTVAGLTIAREVTVPGTGNEDFARTIDTFTNPTDAPITTTATIVGNLGSDAATRVFPRPTATILLRRPTSGSAPMAALVRRP